MKFFCNHASTFDGDLLFELELTSSFVVFQEERSNSMTIGVADEHIGLVVGRGGRNISDISQVCQFLMVLHGIM